MTLITFAYDPFQISLTHFSVTCCPCLNNTFDSNEARESSFAPALDAGIIIITIIKLTELDFRLSEGGFHAKTGLITCIQSHTLFYTSHML